MRPTSVISLVAGCVLTTVWVLSQAWAFGVSWQSPGWDCHVHCVEGELILALYASGTGKWHAPQSHWNCDHLTPAWRQTWAVRFRHWSVAWPLAGLACGAGGIAVLTWLFADPPVRRDREERPASDADRRDPAAT